MTATWATTPGLQWCEWYLCRLAICYPAMRELLAYIEQLQRTQQRLETALEQVQGKRLDGGDEWRRLYEAGK